MVQSSGGIQSEQYGSGSSDSSNILQRLSSYASHWVVSFLRPTFNFWFSASHIAGKSNTGADALNHAVFLAQVSEAA